MLKAAGSPVRYASSATAETICFKEANYQFANHISRFFVNIWFPYKNKPFIEDECSLAIYNYKREKIAFISIFKEAFSIKVFFIFVLFDITTAA